MTESDPLIERQLISLAWLARRWRCSRQTCRRILDQAGIRPFYLGGDSRNSTLRFDLEDILKIEAGAQSPENPDIP